jgi:DNA polymerase-3 subunit delta
VSRPLGGVFYLHGGDEFLKERATRELVERHLDPATRDFNYDILRGPETDLETLASVVGTPPMMAEWRVVVVRDVQAFASSPKARAVLLQAAASAPPGLALILVGTVPSGSKAKFYKELAAATRSQEFKPINPDDAPGWLINWASERYGTEIEPSAATGLVAVAGADLGILDQELAKLAEMVDEGEPIRVADVERGGTRLPSQNRWEWFDLVGSKRFAEALRAVPVLLEQGESGVALVIGVSAHLLRLGVLLTGGVSALESALPPHQRWLAKRLQSQARRWSVPELEDAILGLRRADQMLKASSFGGDHVIEEWLLTRIVTARSAA